MSTTSSGTSTPSSASTSSTDLPSLSAASLNTLGLELGVAPKVRAALVPAAFTGAAPSPTPPPAAPAPSASPTPTLVAPGYITPERISSPRGSTGALWGNVAWERAFSSPLSQSHARIGSTSIAQRHAAVFRHGMCWNVARQEEKPGGIPGTGEVTC
ncbi:unnamed protein product [Cutaneotrichosporon oleaginosum]